jgi:hypothetical protein
LLACGDKKLLRAGIVEQAFLREGADFKVDRPGVVALEPPHRIETFQANARIDFDVRAHAHRALHDRLLQGAPPACVDIVFREATLGGRDLGDGFLQRAFAQRAAIENARLVEMNVGVDEPGRHEPAAGIFGLCRVGRNYRSDFGDLAVRDADIECCLATPGEARSAEDKIEHDYCAASVWPRYAASSAGSSASSAAAPS